MILFDDVISESIRFLSVLSRASDIFLESTSIFSNLTLSRRRVISLIAVSPLYLTSFINFNTESVSERLLSAFRLDVWESIGFLIVSRNKFDCDNPFMIFILGIGLKLLLLFAYRDAKIIAYGIQGHSYIFH